MAGESPGYPPALCREMEAQVNRIIEVKPDWIERYSNRPRWGVSFDSVPKMEALRYKVKEDHYLATLDDYADFFAWTPGSNNGGYGGRSWPVTLLTGEEVTVRGPWSSRSGLINKIFDSTPVVEAHYKSTSCAITIAGLLRWFKENPGCGFGLAKVQMFGDEIYYEPTRKGRLKEDSSVKLLEILA
jgi:hypothetical protein